MRAKQNFLLENSSCVNTDKHIQHGHHVDLQGKERLVQLDGKGGVKGQPCIYTQGNRGYGVRKCKPLSGVRTGAAHPRATQVRLTAPLVGTGDRRGMTSTKPTTHTHSQTFSNTNSTSPKSLYLAIYISLDGDLSISKTLYSLTFSSDNSLVFFSFGGLVK